MTDYYILKRMDGNVTHFKTVKRRTGESHKSLASRCRAIIRKAEETHSGEFYFMESVSLLSTNLCHLHYLAREQNERTWSTGCEYMHEGDGGI